MLLKSITFKHWKIESKQKQHHNIVDSMVENIHTSKTTIENENQVGRLSSGWIILCPTCQLIQHFNGILFKVHVKKYTTLHSKLTWWQKKDWILRANLSNRRNQKNHNIWHIKFVWFLLSLIKIKLKAAMGHTVCHSQIRNNMI